MKTILKIVLFFCFAISSAQVKIELTPKGFTPIEMNIPKKSFDKLIEISKSWGAIYNIKGYNVFDVAQDSFTIDGLNDYAYYYWNMGVQYIYDIKFSIKIIFIENQKYKLTFTVKEIYFDHALTKTKTADFFDAEGNLKQDYEDSKKSLESTANKIVNSYINFVTRS